MPAAEIEAKPARILVDANLPAGYKDRVLNKASIGLNTENSETIVGCKADNL